MKDDASISLLPLSRRAANALQRTGVHTWGQLRLMTREELINIRNIGEGTLSEILECIDSHQAADDAALGPAIADMERLSARAYNLLSFAGYSYVSEIAGKSMEELLEIPRMDEICAREIMDCCSAFKGACPGPAGRDAADGDGRPSLLDMLRAPQYHDAIVEYARANDAPVDSIVSSNRARLALARAGCLKVSDLLGLCGQDISNLPGLGAKSIEHIVECQRLYLEKHATGINAYLRGYRSAAYSDGDLRSMILELYTSQPFRGLSFADISESLAPAVQVRPEKLKQIIGSLLAGKELEYVDFRCHRVYPRCMDFLSSCSSMSEDNRAILMKRLQGMKLEAIAREHGITRERVRQKVNSAFGKLRALLLQEKGVSYFDEDYYKYLYETYEIDKSDAVEWLGFTEATCSFLELMDIKPGKKPLEEAVDDQEHLDAGLRIRIRNYLNRDKLYVDGTWVELKRREIERLVVRKFCRENTTFSEYYELYNDFLRSENVPYDEELYYTPAVIRSRKNRISEADFLLWKLNETFRYYDIAGRDFTELLDALNLDAYEDTELSTEKLMTGYPELMAKYDIRDRYELHNLLRKLVPAGSMHDFRCERMPIIRFGSFDRRAAIWEVIKTSSPISQEALLKSLKEEFGYDEATAMGSYLAPFQNCLYQGVYRVDQKKMPPERLEQLRLSLTNELYSIDEVKSIFAAMFPDADPEEVNGLNLKTAGMTVLSQYVLTGGGTLDACFEKMLTDEDITDVSPYRRKYGHVQAFLAKFLELRRELEIIEFEPNKMINVRKLGQAGVTKADLRKFCTSAAGRVAAGEFFNAASLRRDGHDDPLYDLGFDDLFYNNLLAADSRFSSGRVFGCIVLRKGTESFTTGSFLSELIRSHGSIDLIDLADELKGRFGIFTGAPMEIVYKLYDSNVYYDSILGRLYADFELYCRELEGMGDG